MIPKLAGPIFAMLALAAPPGQAAEATRFQLVPQAGFRAGGSFEDAETGAGRSLEGAPALGVAMELRVRNEDRWWQLWYSRQGSKVKAPDGNVDVDVEYLHIGGTTPISDEGAAKSYLAAGIGATRFSPAGQGLNDATKFSGSLAVGLTTPLSERVALRVEARGYLTLVDAKTTIFCSSDATGGACRFVTTGSTIFQAELTVGIAFGF
jgi:hypothetical protein